MAIPFFKGGAYLFKRRYKVCGVRIKTMPLRFRLPPFPEAILPNLLSNTLKRLQITPASTVRQAKFRKL